jgi:CubicO group peptidase (beta-lactamase class C family)
LLVAGTCAGHLPRKTVPAITIAPMIITSKIFTHGPRPSLSFSARRLACALAMATLMTPAARAAGEVPAATFADPQRRAKLMAALPRIEAEIAANHTADGKSPGLSYAIVIDGDVVLLRGLGLRTAADPASAVQADTVFRIASMSKSFTALAVLMLRDEGKLMLDDPVARHVPQLRHWKLPTADAAPITIRHLLAHMGGLPEDNPQGDYTLNTTPQQLSDWLAGGVPFSTASGSAFEYSNLGFVILGRVVTEVAGQPYQTFVRDRILRPLGMQATRYDPAAVPANQLAHGHRRSGNEWVDVPLLGDGEGGAMGGLLTTAPDLARYVAFMMSAWPARDEPERGPARRSTLREMQAGQGHPELQTQRPLPGAAVGAVALSYGFGLRSAVECGMGRVISHGGGLPGFGSVMRWLPDHGVGLLAMGNSTYYGAGALSRSMLRNLKSTGALLPRVASASPQLQAVAAQVAASLMSPSSSLSPSSPSSPSASTPPAWAADNLEPDEPWAERRAAFAGLQTPRGACKVGALLAENALRGRQRLQCEQGWIDITLTLAPTRPARVQELSFEAGSPLQPAMRDSVASVLLAMAQGPHSLRLAAGLSRTSVAAELEVQRQAVGQCQLDEVLAGDGKTEARVRLRCDRGGGTELSLKLDPLGRISKLSMALSTEDLACVP